MAAIVTEDTVDVRPGGDKVSPDGPDGRGPLSTDVSEAEVAVELGIWLSGIESFLAAGHQSFSDTRVGGAGGDAAREFRLVQSTLQRCALLNTRLLTRNDAPTSLNWAAPFQIDLRDLHDLGAVLRDALLLSDALIRSETLGAGEWRAWSRMLSYRLAAAPVFAALIRYAETEGEKFLPERLKKFVETGSGGSAEHAELALVLPRFARILRWLAVIGKMLEADEPLKTALIVFSRINEQIFELTGYINSRLERFPNEEAELFASLDAASYTASIELKKVYSQELAGLALVRPSPSIFARMETAHSLLNDGFQQILAGFARLIDPTADIFDLFPNFRIKLDQSLVLRRELWSVAQIVQAAEKNPEKREVEALQKALEGLTKNSVTFLFYKDSETVERFIEEILVTKQNKDLVPILHRFGAYLETLFGQVNLRSVLEQHPFEPQA